MARNKTEIRYLSPVDIDKRRKEKYCRFKKMGIKYIDYKDPDFLMRFLNDQGKILPRRITIAFPVIDSCNTLESFVFV